MVWKKAISSSKNFFGKMSFFAEDGDWNQPGTQELDFRSSGQYPDLDQPYLSIEGTPANTDPVDCDLSNDFLTSLLEPTNISADGHQYEYISAPHSESSGLSDGKTVVAMSSAKEASQPPSHFLWYKSAL